MRLLFNIQAHRCNSYLELLVRIIRSCGYLIDLSLDLTPDEYAKVAPKYRDLGCHVRPSGAVIWCGPSQVKNLIETISYCVESYSDWDYLINISGDAVPLADLSELGDAVSVPHQRGVRLLMSDWKTAVVPSEFIATGGNVGAKFCFARGYRNLFYVTEDLRSVFEDAMENPVRRVAKRFYLNCTEALNPKRLYIRSLSENEIAHRNGIRRKYELRCSRAWYCIHRDLCEEIVLESFGKCFDLFETMTRSFEPDETYLATLSRHILRDRSDEVHSNFINALGGTKTWVNDDNYIELSGSGCFFARSIDLNKSTNILRMLESRYLKPSPLH